MANLNCHVETRRLMDRGAASVGRGPLNLDNLDSCSEHLAGLGAVLCVTLFVWVLAIPFFDLGTIRWVKSWEGGFGGVGSDDSPLAALEFRRRMLARYPDDKAAHAAMDRNGDGGVDLEELVSGARTFLPPLSESESRLAFAGLDQDGDGKVEYEELHEACAREQREHSGAGETAATTGAPGAGGAAPPTPGASAESQVPGGAASRTETTTTTPPPSLDCSAGLRSAATAWSAEKRRQCCEREGRGCESTSTSTATSVTSTGSTGSSTSTASATRSETTSETTSTLTTTAATTTGTRTPLNTTTSTAVDVLDTGPVSMAEFKTRMGLALRDSPRDAFAALDSDGNGRSQLDEFVKATEHLTPPLSIMQAEDVFAQLDTNRDSEVEAMEFFAAFEAGRFQPPVHSTPKPITMQEYHQRMGHASQVAAVLVELPGVDCSGFTDSERRALGETVVAALAKQVMVPRSAVKDLSGRSASVSFPAGGTTPVIKGRIDVPSDEVSDDVVRVITDYSTRRELAAHLAQALGRHVHPDGIQVSARKQNSNAFMTIDSDHDGVLNEPEFVDATSHFSPPLSARQARYAFDGLDADRDQRLSAVEYEGYGSEHFFESPRAPETRPGPSGPTPAEVSEAIGMRDFRQRLAASFESPEAAFRSMDRDGDGSLDAGEHAAGTGGAFRPPLERHEAEYSFRGMDADHDQRVTEDEFLKVLHIGHFFPQPTELRATDGPPITMDAFNHRMEAVRLESRPTPHETNRRLEAAPMDFFQRLDSNHDGTLELSEFVEATRAFEPPLTRAQAEYSFAGFDSNHDRTISAEEFVSDEQIGHFFQPPRGGPQPDPPAGPGQAHETALAPHALSMAEFRERMRAALSPQDAFLKLDSDSNGCLDLSEFSSGPKVFVPPLTKAEASRAFHGLDANHDGKVCIAEFFGALRIGHFSQSLKALEAVGAVVEESHAATTPGTAKLPAAAEAGAPGEGQGAPAAPITCDDLKARMGSTTSQEAFSVMDRDADGSVSLAELGGSAQAFSPPLTEDQVEHVFRGLDSDRDGSISAKEFDAVLKAGRFFQPPGALREDGVDPGTAEAESPAPSSKAGPPITVPRFVSSMKTDYASPMEAFQALDTSHDGLLDLDEFIGCTGAFTPPLTREQAEYAFKGFDTDHDSSVHIKEFVGVLMIGKFYQTPEALEAARVPISRLTMSDFKKRMGAVTPEGAFAALDKNGDGHVERGEFLSSGKAFVPPLTGGEAEYAFGGLDANHDGSLGPREFRAVLDGDGFSQRPGAPPAAGAGAGSGGAAHASTPAPTPAPGPDPHVADTPSPRHGGVRDFVRHMGSSYEWPRDAFAALDAGGDGCADRAEFLAGAGTFASPLGSEAAGRAFEGFDADHDGRVCFGEFMAALRTGSFSGQPRSGQLARGSQGGGAVPITAAEFRRHMGAVTPQEAFSEMDKTHDGSMDFDEFNACTRLFSPPLTAEEASHAFSGLDADGDGTVQSDEFVVVLELGKFFPSKEAFDAALEDLHSRHTADESKAAEDLTPSSQGRAQSTITVADFAKRLGPPNETLQEAFDKLDSDGDGSVSRAELEVGTRFSERPLTEDESAGVFRGLDSDGDGAVSLAEFLRTLRAGRFSGPPSGRSGAPPPAPAPTSLDVGVPEGNSPVPMAFGAFRQRLSDGYQSPEDAFNSSDANMDGCLDLGEFAAGARRFRPPLSSGEAAHCFKGMDADHDGRLRPTEFFGALRSGRFWDKGEARAESPGRTKDSAAEPYNCSAGLTNWELGWSSAKKSWCCRREPGSCPQRARGGVGADLGAAKGTASPHSEPRPITLAEFVELARAAYASPRAMFSRMDADGDGLASPAELAGASAAFDPPLSHEDAAWAFEGLDADHDRHLTAAEFVPVLEAAAATALPPPAEAWRAPQGGFRARADEWAGSMRRACAKLDLEGNGRISLGEFLAGVRSFRPPLSEGDARTAFAALDRDGDGRISQGECQLRTLRLAHEVSEFARGMQALGSPGVALHRADNDGDGMLSRGEFLALGSMLGLSLDSTRLADIMSRLDVNQDHYIDGHELRTPVTSAKDGPATQTISSSDVGQYLGVPAIVEGRAEITLSFGREADVPEEAEIERRVRAAFMLAMKEELGLEVNVASLENLRRRVPETTEGAGSVGSAGSAGSAGSMGSVGSAERSVMVLWTADAEDGGALQGRLLRSPGLASSLGASVERAPWPRGGRAAAWLECTLDFYGPGAARLPAGKKLAQRFGRRPGGAAGGLPAVVLA